ARRGPHRAGGPPPAHRRGLPARRRPGLPRPGPGARARRDVPPRRDRVPGRRHHRALDPPGPARPPAGDGGEPVGARVPAIRSKALVLRSVEGFEASLVATLFTRALGKGSGLAKGGRRLRSPFLGGLDLLAVSDIVVLHKASEALDLLTEAAPVERFPSLRRDLAALYAGYYVAELLTDLTDFHDPHPRLFDAAVVTLRHLGDPALRDRRLLRFELACLRELGHMPTLDACAHCGAAVAASGGGRGYAFGLATGGV